MRGCEPATPSIVQPRFGARTFLGRLILQRGIPWHRLTHLWTRYVGARRSPFTEKPSDIEPISALGVHPEAFDWWLKPCRKITQPFTSAGSVRFTLRSNMRDVICMAPLDCGYSGSWRWAYGTWHPVGGSRLQASRTGGKSAIHH